jgi:hypothetical protein
MFHKHNWEYWSGGRLELHGKTFMVNIYLCDGCNQVKSRASDMQPYLDMKEYHIG